MAIIMTDKKIQQFNQMRHTLLRISKEYMSPEQLRKNAEKLYGLDYEDYIEMVYENIQGEASEAVKGVREIKLDTPTEKSNEPLTS